MRLLATRMRRLVLACSGFALGLWVMAYGDLHHTVWAMIAGPAATGVLFGVVLGMYETERRRRTLADENTAGMLELLKFAARRLREAQDGAPVRGGHLRLAADSGDEGRPGAGPHPAPLADEPCGMGD